ncbi:ATP-binding protein [Pseudoduganella sp. SL102]|uniref:ATP-binding protein n=1 Tax=Pseudoduganella sp. SL102 TaxID=2995154 RepID=UPI00248C4C4F|nr:ATP-binding protein [Pseudoduganella sp. SL102]WBS04911.1 ATP-binding protein [Pseudoduganella sp. SL102]
MENPPAFRPSFAGEGVVRALLRARDWSNFPYGQPEAWPREIRSTIEMVLDAAAPTAFYWGPDCLYFYNDAYLQVLGDKHPAALATPFWGSWEELREGFAPILAEALAGKACNLSDIRFTVVRNGVPETAYFSYALYPVFGARGEVAGILNPAVDSTAAMVSNRRREFQLRLGDLIRELTDPGDVVAGASALLGEYMGVDRVVYLTVDDAGEAGSIGRDWSNGHLPSMAGVTVRLDDYGAFAAQGARAGRHLIISDVVADERSAPFAHAYAALGVRAVLAIPLLKNGRLRVILSAHDSAPHVWTKAQIGMAEDMLERTWSAVENVGAQAELRRERDQSEYIFDNMAEGFAMLDTAWRIVRMNGEGLRLTHKTAADVIGRSHWEVWPGLLGTPLEALYRQVMDDCRSGVIEVPCATPQGEIWMEVRAYPALDGGLAVFFRDVTARRKSDEKLRETDRRKDEFLAMLAHELRNPLAPISAAAELLQLGKVDEARVRQTSQVIGRQVRHMTSLVDDLLDVSRVTRGLVELDMQPIDIHRIVTDAIEQVTPLIRTRRHHLGLELTPDIPLVSGDRNRLVQVFANLLNNAAKYTPEGGHIGLRTEVRPDHVLFHITDTGIGMAPSLAARAFDLFSQAERSSDRSLGGLGLGLALVKSLVHLHRGTVTCSSPGLGQGSRFTVCLPRLAAQEEQAAAPPQEAPRPRSGGPALRIMVVDDNADAASVLAMLLESARHEVIVEYDASEALALSAASGCDVFLLDIGLPGMDGIELARRLRAQPETADAVLVAITGYGLQSDRIQTAAAGFDHHLVKPVDIDELFAILANVGQPGD